MNDNNYKWRTAVQAYGMDVKITFQPAQSPDLNILDLGLFALLQAMQHKAPMRNFEAVIQRVEHMFMEMQWQTVDAISQRCNL